MEGLCSKAEFMGLFEYMGFSQGFNTRYSFNLNRPSEKDDIYLLVKHKLITYLLALNQRFAQSDRQNFIANDNAHRFVTFAQNR